MTDMKYVLTLIALCVLLFSCNTSPIQETENQKPEILKNSSSDTLKEKEEMNAAKTDTPAQAVQQVEKKRAGNVRGKVSHMFRKNGCSTVIVMKDEVGEEELVLIPKDPLKKELDKDGQIIYFNYHPLKMPNPPGCVKGMPAEITDAEAE